MHSALYCRGGCKAPLSAPASHKTCGSWRLRTARQFSHGMRWEGGSALIADRCASKFYITTIKASDTLEHDQPMVWPVPTTCVLWTWRCLAPASAVKGRVHRAYCLGSKGQLSMVDTARVIWLCACVRFWPDRGLLFECVTCFYCCYFSITDFNTCERRIDYFRLYKYET